MVTLVKKSWLLILIVLQPILDIIAFFQYDSSIGTMAGFFRLAVMIVIPIVVIFKQRKISFIILLGVIGLYCCLHVIGCYINGYTNPVEDIAYMMKVVQMPVLGISFCYILDKEEYKEQVVNAFVINYVIIVLTMIAAHLSGTGLYTYNDYKIGYMGWFANANAQSIILISMAPFVIYWAVKRKNKVGVLIAILSTTIILILNGTKAGYIAAIGINLGLACFYFIDFFRKKGKRRKIQIPMVIFLITVSIIAIVVYPITPRYEMDTQANGKRDEENLELENKKKDIQAGALDLKQILQDPELKQQLIECYEMDLNKDLVDNFGIEAVLEKYGWAPDSYTLADVRLQKRINAELTWERSSISTRFFGIEFTEMKKYDLENDYPAIYYYYGYVGIGLYLTFLLYFLVLILKMVITKFDRIYYLFNYILALTFILQLGLAQFSGAILRRPNASIYLSIIVGLIYYQCKKIEKNS